MENAKKKFNFFSWIKSIIVILFSLISTLVLFIFGAPIFLVIYAWNCIKFGFALLCIVALTGYFLEQAGKEEIFEAFFDLVGAIPYSEYVVLASFLLFVLLITIASMSSE